MDARSQPENAPPRSVWQPTPQLPLHPPLAEDLTVDVAIVGAGIAGMTTAYLLTQAGRRVAVLDDGPIADGMTAMTSAHLTAVIDDRFVTIERLHGEHGARLAAASHTAAIARIETIVGAERIDCGFERVDGWLFQPPGADPAELQQEFAAARRAGMQVEQVARAPFAGFDTGPCLRFAAQAQFHPLRYLAGLAAAIVRGGGRIYNHSHVDRVEGGDDARVVVGRHTVRAGAVVVATNAPINNRVAIHTKQAPYMTYVIAATLPRGVVPTGLYWDTADPYHYVRLFAAPDGQHLLIVGGEDHKTGQANDTLQRHGRLEQWARERFPQLGQVVHRWAGQVMETIDGLAFIGRNPLDADNVFVVTGDSGMGLTHGTIAGMLLTDLMLGRANEWATLYAPNRKTLRAAKEFARETLNMAAQYADWIKPADVGSVDEIPRNTGATLTHGLTKHAVFRDEHGVLHRFSAVCPHLGCVVHWNAAERSFDCPCHGSRFDAHGTVINGPANRNLAPADDA